MGEHKFSKKRPSSYKSKKSRSVATTVIVIVAIAVMIVMDVMNRRENPALAFLPERTQGGEAAPLQIVEFIDFQCPMCARGAAMLREVMAQYPDDIRLTVKYYPLGELNSSMSAYYAECAARQGKFWEMQESLLETQDSWRTLLKVQPFFNQLGEQAGLDMVRLTQCVEEKDVHKAVAAERVLGEANFVKSTPTYFINGQMAVGIRALEEALQSYFENKQ